MKSLALGLSLVCSAITSAQLADIKQVEAAAKDFIVAARRDGFEGIKSLCRLITVDEKDPSQVTEKARLEMLRSFADGMRSLNNRVEADDSLADKNKLFADLIVALPSKGTPDPKQAQPWISSIDRVMIWEFRFPLKIDDRLWPERRRGIIAARWYLFFVLDKGQIKLDHAAWTLVSSLPPDGGRDFFMRQAGYFVTIQTCRPATYHLRN